jgi:hypothetical protein
MDVPTKGGRMEEKLYTVYARLEPSQGERLKATLEREKRTMQAVVELALDRYIAESEAQAAKAEKKAKQPA